MLHKVTCDSPSLRQKNTGKNHGVKHRWKDSVSTYYTLLKKWVHSVKGTGEVNNAILSQMPRLHLYIITGVLAPLEYVAQSTFMMNIDEPKESWILDLLGSDLGNRISLYFFPNHKMSSQYLRCLQAFICISFCHTRSSVLSKTRNCTARGAHLSRGASFGQTPVGSCANRHVTCLHPWPTTVP